MSGHQVETWSHPKQNGKRTLTEAKSREWETSGEVTEETLIRIAERFQPHPAGNRAQRRAAKRRGMAKPQTSDTTGTQ